MTAASGPRPHLLVTGFGPFPTMPRNPAGAAAERVASSPRWRVLGCEVRDRVLQTSYAALDAELAPALADRPAAILMIGVAGRATRIRVETRGTARRSRLFPDATGTTARTASSGAGAGAVRVTRVPPSLPRRALASAGLPVRVSRDAGRYLCNASYFQALAEPVPVLFVHIPKTPSPKTPSRLRPARPGPRHRLGWTARLDAALVAIAIGMLRQARVEAAAASR